MEDFNTRFISSADANTTVVIRKKGENSPGKLGYISVIAMSAHTVSFYDGENGTTGDLICTIPASAVAQFIKLNRPCNKGISAVVAASFAGSILAGFK